jgi:hypothetical protein
VRGNRGRSQSQKGTPVAISAPISPDRDTASSSDTARIIAQHRAETEQAIAHVRYDASLDDLERGRQITWLLAEANRRTLALYADAPHGA